MIYEVELRAYGGGAIREVSVPESEMWHSDEQLLDLIFKYGQNDFQPRQLPSVSVGDVIRLLDKKFLVKSIGFQEIRE